MVLPHRIELHPLRLQRSAHTSYAREALMAEGKRIELSTLRWDGFQDHLCTLHPTLLLLWSEWQDSNLRPTDSKSATLPNCATLRNFIMVDPLGIEPRPDGLKDRCPNLLCEGSIIWCFLSESNRVLTFFRRTYAPAIPRKQIGPVYGIQTHDLHA